MLRACWHAPCAARPTTSPAHRPPAANARFQCEAPPSGDPEVEADRLDQEAMDLPSVSIFELAAFSTRISVIRKTLSSNSLIRAWLLTYESHPILRVHP